MVLHGPEFWDHAPRQSLLGGGSQGRQARDLGSLCHRDARGFRPLRLGPRDDTAPEAVRPALRSAVLNLMYPPMTLLTQLVRGDQDRFTTKLAKTVEWHKDFWTRDEERERDSDGIIALGHLALACLALDSGFSVEVESEYLPKYLLDGGWVGEFPT
ncbi:immunity 49 family protein [Streptomyces sp. ISL-96]|uniref:immunity 49 family protein n=1 Tax=Streptomyces sp. ISL-96 TaxID=2819191 RepID=UPI0027E2A61D|nr:immunity 49 family protein [Streptomyces sp. ISL-96]